MGRNTCGKVTSGHVDTVARGGHGGRGAESGVVCSSAAHVDTAWWSEETENSVWVRDMIREEWELCVWETWSEKNDNYVCERHDQEGRILGWRDMIREDGIMCGGETRPENTEIFVWGIDMIREDGILCGGETWSENTEIFVWGRDMIIERKTEIFVWGRLRFLCGGEIWSEKGRLRFLCGGERWSGAGV